MDMDIDEKEHPLVLEKDVKAFEMEFWDVRSGDWLDEWTQTNQLPPLVKITLKFGGDKSRLRPAGKGDHAGDLIASDYGAAGLAKTGSATGCGAIRVPGLIR